MAAKMLAAGIKTPTPLEELECHLREDIERQVKVGVSEQDAFTYAVQAFGKGEMLKKEFAKAEDANEARKYQLVQIIFNASAGLFPLSVVGLTLFDSHYKAQLSLSQQISALAAATTFSLLIWFGRLSYRLLPVIPTRLIRDAIVSSCGALMIIWWFIFLYIIAPRHDFTFGQFAVLLIWEMITPAGAICGFIWGLETAARKPIETTS